MRGIIPSPFFCVHCRIGSLENFAITINALKHVHCRIGSLEKILYTAATPAIVHCRIGSLEKLVVSV